MSRGYTQFGTGSRPNQGLEERQVRVQRLGPDLEPSGEPLLVSPKGANAGQGVVFARSPRALSLFVQTTAGHDELWGTSLECP